MAATNAKEALNNLYGLMMEINFHKPEEEVIEQLSSTPDAFVELHLKKMKQLMAKLRGEAHKQRFTRALEELQKLKEKGIDELRKLLTVNEQMELQPLFRKFEELTPEDERALLEDQDVLRLMEILKDRLEEDDKA